MDMFIHAFEDQMLPRIDELMEDPSLLRVSDLLDLVSWIEFHKMSYDMLKFSAKKKYVLDSLDSKKTELLIEYKDRIKKQVATWFDNIKKQPLEIVKSSNNALITSNPEDMFNIIHAQLDVARYCLMNCVEDRISDLTVGFVN